MIGLTKTTARELARRGITANAVAPGYIEFDMTKKDLPNNPCENCGICCLSFSLPPFDANELVRASDDLLRQVDDYAHSARYQDSNPCLWLDLDSGKCRHHESRPFLCRWFEPGWAACNDLRVKAGLPILE